MHKNYLFLTLFLPLLFISCGNYQIISPKEVAEKLLILDSLSTEIGISSCQLTYFSGESNLSIVAKQQSDSALCVAADQNSIYQAASLSKPLFAYIVMKMVDSGEIDLDTPLCKYTDIDRFEDKEEASKLTARLVLSHQSGLPNWATSPSSEVWPTSVITFKYRVGSCFAYSGEGFALLQRAVEAIRHSTLDEIARKEVFDPFDMPSSSYKWLPEYDSTALCGFNRENVNRGQGRHPRENCAYTLRTNAKEYSRFLKGAILEGRGLSPEAHKAMLTPQVQAVRYADNPRGCDSTIFWCIGIGAIVGENGVPTHYWHWGDNGNFKALFVVKPESKEVLNYFTNSAKGHDIVSSVTDLFLGERLPIDPWINE